MTTVDWVILGIVTISTVMSLWRGASREIVSVITWVAAIYLGVVFASSLEGLFAHFIEDQTVRFSAGFIVIFLVVMIVGGLLARLLTSLLSFTGLTFVDRILGIIFGLVRGVLILTVFVVLANYTTVPQDKWWKDSRLLPHFDGIAKQLSAWVQKQGFDPKKLETWASDIVGKPDDNKTANDKLINILGVPGDQAKPKDETTNVLGVPVDKQEADHNVLGVPVGDDGNAKTNSSP